MPVFGKPRKPGKQIVPPAGRPARGREIPGNGSVHTFTFFGPDPLSVQMSNTMAIVPKTYSPYSRGVHDHGRWGFTGLPGYGVGSGLQHNGRSTGPVQRFWGAIAPIRAENAKNKRLGIGAGVSGQPGLPNTGDGNIGPLGLMTSVGGLGLGGLGLGLYR